MFRKIGMTLFFTSILFLALIQTSLLSASQTKALANAPQIDAVRIVSVSPTVSAEQNVTVEKYAKFEIAFDIPNRNFETETNPYLPYRIKGESAPVPTGVVSKQGITVDALLLPPTTTVMMTNQDWERYAIMLPCFYYQPVDSKLLPNGKAEWRCRFTPDIPTDQVSWKYRIRVTDSDQTWSPSDPNKFYAFQVSNSTRNGFVRVHKDQSGNPTGYFEFSNGKPFTYTYAYVNIDWGAGGNPLATFADIESNLAGPNGLAANGIHFVRWFPYALGGNWLLTPYGGALAPTWGFGNTFTEIGQPCQMTDCAFGKQVSMYPYYFTQYTGDIVGTRSIPAAPNTNYQLSFRAKITGEQVLRVDIAGKQMDICSMQSDQYHLHNGTDGSGAYDTIALSGTFADQKNGYGTLAFFTWDILNTHPGGIALINPQNQVVEFLSYGGQFTATGGLAVGSVSTDIRITETNSTALNSSLQRQSDGASWLPSTKTFGSANSSQYVPNSTDKILINEIHYNNVGSDHDKNQTTQKAIPNEGVEIAGPKGKSLNGWKLVFYSANLATITRTERCTMTAVSDTWQDYQISIANTSNTLALALRGLYVWGNRYESNITSATNDSNVPEPYNRFREGKLLLHSIALRKADSTMPGGWGPNLLSRADPQTQSYVDQLGAARLDKVFELAEKSDLYLKLPILDRNDEILNRIEPNGALGSFEQDNRKFFTSTGSIWYQTAYLRYFIARWGYSPSLHSVELTNESAITDIAMSAAFTFAVNVRDISPRKILVSNSFESDFPVNFWKDERMDYADRHWYACVPPDCPNPPNPSGFWFDPVEYIQEARDTFNSYREKDGITKPIVRGEGGVWLGKTVGGKFTPDMYAKLYTNATLRNLYFHKKTWAQIGVLSHTVDGEWYAWNDKKWPDSSGLLRFMKDEQVNNGQYVEIDDKFVGDRKIDIFTTNGALRVLGIRNSTVGRALVWIDNKENTWKNLMDNKSVTPVNGTVVITGFLTGDFYKIERWDTSTGAPAQVQPDQFPYFSTDHRITITVENLTSDFAVKITPVPLKLALKLIDCEADTPGFQFGQQLTLSPTHPTQEYEIYYQQLLLSSKPWLPVDRFSGSSGAISTVWDDCSINWWDPGRVGGFYQAALVQDSDHDNLTDFYETKTLDKRCGIYNPMDPDSITDGVLDGDLDPDHDGLTNQTEYKGFLGRGATDPCFANTDTDVQKVNDLADQFPLDPVAWYNNDSDQQPDQPFNTENSWSRPKLVMDDQFSLTIGISGAGSVMGMAEIYSGPTTFQCIADCKQNFFDDTVISLTATSTSDSVFQGWSGAGCSGTSPCVITMNSHQSVAATFTKVGKATITIVKDALPDSPRNFQFYGPWGDFYIDDPGEDDGDAIKNSKRYIEVPAPGTYTFSERKIANWFFTDVKCGPNDAFTVNPSDRSVTLNVNPGDNIICTFTNKYASSLTVLSYWDMDQDGQHDPTEDWQNGWWTEFYDSSGTLKASNFTQNGGHWDLYNIRPGTYTVCQKPQEGWNNTKPIITDPAHKNWPCYTFDLSYAQVAKAYFGYSDQPFVANADEQSAQSGLEIIQVSDPEQDALATWEEFLAVHPGDRLPDEDEAKTNIYLPVIER